MFLPLVVAAALSGCSYIDEDLSKCNKTSTIEYELRLVTNMTTELRTELDLSTDLKLTAELKAYLAPVFTDFAHDLDLSFYRASGDSLRLFHDTHIMDDSQTSYTLHIPVRYGGLCNLRFDDTNPAKEDNEYAEAIKRDIEWLGFHWTGGLFYASDYYQRLYDIAEDFIKRGLAYVDELSAEEMREYRGTLTTPGKNSPWRDRPMEESLDLFRRMKAGEFPEGRYILRAKIDMASPNMNMRDPAMYRILYKEHWRTGNTWCIYPMYDFAHPLSDAFEGITFSLCSLEFEDHRPLYDWFVEKAGFHAGDGKGYFGPRQIEFARLNITRTVMSKRFLRKLVEEGYVSGWDDPRMPTLTAMRRRGYPGSAIRAFVEQVGLAKADSTVDVQMLDACVRDALGDTAPRVMAVLNPVKVVFTNVPDGWTDTLKMENHPDHPELGEREVTISKEIWIEREDFEEVPPKKFFRLKPDGEVRLKGAYIIKCENVVKNEAGEKQM